MKIWKYIKRLFRKRMSKDFKIENCTFFDNKGDNLTPSPPSKA